AARGGARERGGQERVAGAAPSRGEWREVPPVALSGAEPRQVGETQRDQRARNREHDEERLGIECVPGRGAETVTEVVDEDDLAGKSALDPVLRSRRLLKRVRRASRRGGGVKL